MLEAAADEYEPDADRLKALVAARIAQQSEESEARTTRRTRARGGASRRGGLGLLGRLGLAGIPAGVALATVGAAAAIAVGATATIAVTSSNGHHSVTVAAPTPSPNPGGSAPQGSGPSESASPAATTEATRRATAASSSATSSGSPASPSASALVAGTSSVGQASNPNWSELDLSVTIKQPLTALHVTVKVSKCSGLSSTGSWNSGASGEFTEVTTTDSAGSITYEFELAKGDTATPGTLTFAVQFNHATSGWAPQDDTFYVSARTATSTSASSIGGAY
ncbi:hypothetical protein KDK95_32040 [Actinospica sp. MGRD01-02]|uniref:Uncharacterized protein n=1 Tax=Actinospica acidithermotolerans TaxID=2828514 RepID=A0A941EHV4_9ACTN|nr:hypothetical protein [Actinospica acidithermotolerans]MBR7830980.1 hypothetical protein [Actinospica acidithermotolerans]